MALLQTCDTSQAAEALGSLPFEQQQRRFRRLPLGLAASLVTQFPYYDQYVLLHAPHAGEMRALVDKISPDDRVRFFDELPEEAWQRLMDELSSAPVEIVGMPETESIHAPEQQLPKLAELLPFVAHSLVLPLRETGDGG